MSWTDVLMNEDTLALMIPIVAVVVGGIIAITAMIIKHRERIAMIEQGMHPDRPPEEPGMGEDLAGEPGAFEQTQSYQQKRVPMGP